MITCPVCHSENDHYATVCTNCKGFLQNRIPNLDLFETVWGVVESPRRTFRNITLAEHKNYSLFLFVLFGISLSFTSFWYLRLGSRFETLFELIFWALGVGVLAGIGLAVILPTTFHLGAKAIGGKTGLRSSLGLLSYSLVPIVASLFFILPVELLTFGMYLFTANPHPYTIKPFSYLALVGFDVGVSLWSIVLAIVAASVGHQISTIKSVLVVLVTIIVLGCVFFLSPKAFPGLSASITAGR